MNTWMYRLLASVLFLIVMGCDSGSNDAKELTVSGKISSASDHSPIPQASVRLMNSKWVGYDELTVLAHTATDQSGEYKLTYVLEDCPEFLEVVAPGFESVRRFPGGDLLNNDFCKGIRQTINIEMTSSAD